MIFFELQNTYGLELDEIKNNKKITGIHSRIFEVNLIEYVDSELNGTTFAGKVLNGILFSKKKDAHATSVDSEAAVKALEASFDVGEDEAFIVFDLSRTSVKSSDVVHILNYISVKEQLNALTPLDIRYIVVLVDPSMIVTNNELGNKYTEVKRNEKIGIAERNIFITKVK